MFNMKAEIAGEKHDGEQKWTNVFHSKVKNIL